MIPVWVRKLVDPYNLGEMAVMLGVWTALAAFLAIILGVILYGLGVPETLAVDLGYGTWFLLVGLMWLACVIVGRQRASSRTSDRDLTALQILLLIGIGWASLASPKSDESMVRTTELGSEWMILAFHVVYFSLAWATRARVPLKTYLLFLGLLALVLFRT